MIIVDVEIKKAILGRGEERIPDIEYCAGWRDFDNMGISVVCTYDTDTHLSRAFLEADLGTLACYLHKKPTAGFNTKRFDNPLLHEYGIDVDGSLHYDMLEQIWIALGLNPDKFNPHTHGGWGLDAVCKATLGIAKTGNGALAPVWWQQGRRGKVIDYCLNDVWMEGQLLLHILRGEVVTNAAGHVVHVARPDSPGTVEGLNAEPTREARMEELRQGIARDLAEDAPEKVLRDTTSAGLGIIR